MELIKSIKQGEDLVMDENRVIKNQHLTFPAPPVRSYAFCSDTAYTERFIHQIKGADMLYHEATFLMDMAHIAGEKTHSTTIDAATLAKKGEVKKLILGHYSARYDDTQMFVNEARTVFENTVLGEEGLCIAVGD